MGKAQYGESSAFFPATTGAVAAFAAAAFTGLAATVAL